VERAVKVDRSAVALETNRFGVGYEVDASVAGDDCDRSAITTHDDVSQYCPVCSQRLESRRCKLICPVCGYYMSCADYY